MKNKEVKKQLKEKKKGTRTSIGGQAVMEGVMMRGKSSMAVAVRDGEGIIRLETSRFKETKKKNIFFRLPIVRGVINFISMMIVGIKTLTKSAEVFGEEEPTKFEKWLAEKFKIDIMSVVIFFAMLLGIGLALGLFFVLPSIITLNLFRDTFGWHFSPLNENLIEGGVRFLIFLSYLLLVSLLKDIRRVFMYHGAEHRVISCFERGYDMTVQNAQKCSTVHNRCGTTFLFFVMLMSIIVFALFDGIMANFGVNISQNAWVKIGIKLCLLPLVAGLSYELLKLLAKTDFFLLWPLKAPGLLLQLITTKKPTDDMVEVALTSFMAVKEMDENPDISAVQFVKPQKVKAKYDEVSERFKQANIDDISEVDWIFCEVLGCKRDKITERDMLTITQVERLNEIVERRLTGMPSQYAIGSVEFYGYKLKTDERALIPRFDTEILAEAAIKEANAGSRVLDLCTGSGAVAIAVAKKTGASVAASDISSQAISLAKENAWACGARIEFVESDMFSGLIGEKFDIIVSNPPYIPSGDIEKLDGVVKDYEPMGALDGGADGLDFYRLISREAFYHLNEKGALLLEVGINQAEDVKAIFCERGYGVEIIKDLCGIDRVIKVKVAEVYQNNDNKIEGNKEQI